MCSSRAESTSPVWQRPRTTGASSALAGLQEPPQLPSCWVLWRCSANMARYLKQKCDSIELVGQPLRMPPMVFYFTFTIALGGLFAESLEEALAFTLTVPSPAAVLSHS